jgi:branched-chain amino acid transport system permease protein
VPVLALLALPLIGSGSTWLTLTVAGLAMGMIIFIIASGLTLVFGLMDVLNFGHGVFIALGAYVATSVLAGMGDWTTSAELWRNLVALLLAMTVGMMVAGAVGVAFERVIVRPVYGQHLKQILITMGGMIIGEELIKVIWGPQQMALPMPEALRGSLLLGDASIERYRVVAVMVGVAVFALLAWTLSRTKIGLLIRAGVQDREMVESLGYRIRRLFVGVFVVGSALAGLGGVMWGLYQQSVTPQMGAQVNILIFIVIIIGGLGSTGGALIGALLVGLMANYTGFLAPKVALFSNIALMVAVLLWRPQGVYPVRTVANRELPHAECSTESSPTTTRAASCWRPSAGGCCWAWRSRRSSSPASRRCRWPPRCWCSSCWWPALTCCWATPAS